MNNSEILRKVAVRELTPAEGAEQMIQEDRQQAVRMRPTWMPSWAWMLVLFIAAGVLAACGVNRD